MESAERLSTALGGKLPRLALVLGSGFRDVLTSFQIESEVAFADIPGFPSPRVNGHSGRVLKAHLEGLEMLILCGRAHYYEGYSMDAVMYPVQVLAECGVKELLLTNAAGGINPEYKPGDFMLFSDHINFTGTNPLRGLPVEDGRCFVDLSDAYCAQLGAELRSAARHKNLTLREGVYLGVSGPTYETPAEIRAFRTWGADAVGMSTIPEVLMARYCGMRVAAISCITNCAAGMNPGKLSHQEVLQAGQANAANAARLLSRFAQLHRGGAPA
jgi:purine-nucleoside phosphorylase